MGNALPPSFPSSSDINQPSNPSDDLLEKARADMHSRRKTTGTDAGTGVIKIIAVAAIVLIIGGVVIVVGKKLVEGFGDMQDQVASSAQNILDNVTRGTIEVEIEAGTAFITDKPEGTSHVKIECNNGLIIDADWERNSYNEFGYDIYEPEVSMDYNRLAVMVLARGVIAEYLNGGYD